MAALGKVRGTLHGESVLVWSASDIEFLRQSWRIVGGLIGANPLNPRQNHQLGPPLLLLPEEASLLLKKGILEMDSFCQDTCVGMHKQDTDDSDPTQMPIVAGTSPLKCDVFCDLWECGYYITSGLKYGGDFLIYQADPNHTHSSFIACVLPWQQSVGHLSALCRVASQVKKNILLCGSQGQSLSYYTLQWAGDLQSCISSHSVSGLCFLKDDNIV